MIIWRNAKEIQFWDLGIIFIVDIFLYAVVIKVSKNFSNFLFLSKWYRVITVCWCKQTTIDSFQTCLYYLYLVKLYNKWIIILLIKNLTNIYRKISKYRLILWMVYTCIVKLLEEAEKLGRNERRWRNKITITNGE